MHISRINILNFLSIATILAFVGGSKLSYAQEVDFFDNWYNTSNPADSPVPLPSQTAPAATVISPEPVDSVTSSTPPPPASGDADYSGYYKVGKDLYYYDQRNGQFVVAVRGTPNGAATSKSSSPELITEYPQPSTPNLTPSLPNRTSQNPVDRVINMLTMSSGNEKSLSKAMICRTWMNPLHKREPFSNSSECQADLENSIEQAILQLENENESFEKQLPLQSVQIPEKVRSATSLRRDRLQIMLASLGKQGCNCLNEK
jgi:hypothetical protein